MKKEDSIDSWIWFAAVGAALAVAVVSYFIIKSDKAKQNLENATLVRTTESYEKAVIKTNLGDIEIELLPREAPATVRNFVKLAKKGFYDGTKFHRIIKDFMIQGGDPLSREESAGRYGAGGPGYTFEDEINDEPMKRGVVAMANSGPNTNGSQFFIVTAAAAPWLEGNHTIFARVFRGMDVVDKISFVPTFVFSQSIKDVPKEPVVIERVILE